jgi:hypothetical protein
MYEVCQLGRHCPISKTLRNGILKVGQNSAEKLNNDPIDEWFTMLPNIPTAATLRLYAQVRRETRTQSVSVPHSLPAPY